MKLNKLSARYAIFGGPVMLESQDLYTSDTVRNHPLGTLAFGDHGKMFRYAYVGGSALVAGNTLQEAAIDTTMTNMVVPTAAKAGDLYFSVTNGTATITSAQFTDGTIGVYTAGTVAVGDEYVIQAVTGTFTTGGALKVWTERPLRYAVTTSATLNMRTSPWGGVIQSTGTTASGMCAGVAVWALPLNTYGWVQSHGECTVLADATSLGVGSDLALSATVAGAAGLYAVGTSRQRIGLVRQAIATAKGVSAFLQID